MFEWDARKAAVNHAKHGVSFEEAGTVFADPNALDGPDLSHSEREPRFLRLGRAATGRVLDNNVTLRPIAECSTARHAVERHGYGTAVQDVARDHDSPGSRLSRRPSHAAACMMHSPSSRAAAA